MAAMLAQCASMMQLMAQPQTDSQAGAVPAVMALAQASGSGGAVATASTGSTCRQSKSTPAPAPAPAPAPTPAPACGGGAAMNAPASRPLFDNQDSDDSDDGYDCHADQDSDDSDGPPEMMHSDSDSESDSENEEVDDEDGVNGMQSMSLDAGTAAGMPSGTASPTAAGMPSGTASSSPTAAGTPSETAGAAPTPRGSGLPPAPVPPPPPPGWFPAPVPPPPPPPGLDFALALPSQMGMPPSGTGSPFGSKRIATAMEYAIRNAWKPGFNDGHPQAQPFKYTMKSCGVPTVLAPFKTAFNQVGLHPAPARAAAMPVTQSVPPHPDDYRFAGVELYFCDWVHNYDVCLECVTCHKKDKLFPSVWTHTAAVTAAQAERKGKKAVNSGIWSVVGSDQPHNYATAKMRRCGHCHSVQHDMQVNVLQQLPTAVLMELPFTVQAVKTATNNAIVSKSALREFEWHLHNGGGVARFRESCMHRAALRDEDNASRYYAHVVLWQEMVHAQTGEKPERHFPYYGAGERGDMRNTVRVEQYPLLQKAFVDAFAESFPAAYQQVCKRGLLGPKPFERSKEIVLCVDHCKTGGDNVSEGFALNCVDCETRELMHQEYVSSCKIEEICQALHDVCDLPYIRGNVKAIYYDKVTKPTEERIVRATGTEHVLQDIWHVCNRLNSCCNNRVGGELYERHVAAVSACFFQWNKDILHNVKRRLWARDLASFVQLPDGRRVQFKSLTNTDIFTHLMRPAGWEPGCGWEPAVPSNGDPNALKDFIQRLLPTAKFFDTFAKNLQKDVRPKADIKKDLMEVYHTFRLALNKGKNLYPHKGRMLKRFQNAMARINYVEDPAGVCMYRSVGFGARGLEEFICLRGTQTVESYHAQSNEFIHSHAGGKLNADVAKTCVFLGNLRWNYMRRQNLPPGHALRETNVGHAFWWEAARTVLLARQAAAPTAMIDALKFKALPPVTLEDLGFTAWPIDRENMALQRGGGNMLLHDTTDPALGKRKVGRPMGAKDSKPRKKKGAGAVEDDQQILLNLLEAASLNAHGMELDTRESNETRVAASAVAGTRVAASVTACVKSSPH